MALVLIGGAIRWMQWRRCCLGHGGSIVWEKGTSGEAEWQEEMKMMVVW